MTTKQDKAHILYDETRGGKAEDGWFSPGYWRERGAITGRAHGRGTTWFVRSADGEHWVLRHYRRGGLIARVLRDRYLWLGLKRTRAWREWRLLAELHAAGLPVPRPVAARVRRRGMLYTADILIERIDGTHSLAQRLSRHPLVPALWRAIGASIQRLHAAGIYHADLNAHNILLDRHNRIYIVDFDRARRRRPGTWQVSNLARLERSLKKLHAHWPNFAFRTADWQVLLDGYRQASESEPV